MADNFDKQSVDLRESSVHGKDSGNDVATDAALDRLESITGGADDPVSFEDEEMERQAEVLDASTEEELDALEVNLTQDDQDMRNTSYGTGLIEDDVAEERLAGFTEVGPDLAGRGAVPAVPGRDDTSHVIRLRHPNGEIARAEDVVEGNLDEPRDEELGDREVDEGTAA